MKIIKIIFKLIKIKLIDGEFFENNTVNKINTINRTIIYASLTNIPDNNSFNLFHFLLCILINLNSIESKLFFVSLNYKISI